MPEQSTITLFETCEKLNKSKKSISRYIRKGLLHPKQIKSKQGTLEYRFSESDIEAFKQKQSEARQDRQDTQDKADETMTTPLPDKKEEEKQEKVLDEMKTEKTGQDTPDKTEQTGHIYSKEQETEKKILDKAQTDETGQERRDETGRDKTGQTEIIELLKETTGLLKEQLTKKDEQINKLNDTGDNLVERNREMSILLKGLQDKVIMLERPKERAKKSRERQEEAGEQAPIKTEEKRGFFNKLFS